MFCIIIHTTIVNCIDENQFFFLQFIIRNSRTSNTKVTFLQMRFCVSLVWLYPNHVTYCCIISSEYFKNIKPKIWVLVQKQNKWRIEQRILNVLEENYIQEIFVFLGIYLSDSNNIFIWRLQSFYYNFVFRFIFSLMIFDVICLKAWVVNFVCVLFLLLVYSYTLDAGIEDGLSFSFGIVILLLSLISLSVVYIIFKH